MHVLVHLQDWVRSFFRKGGHIHNLDKQVRVHNTPTYIVLGAFTDSTIHISFTFSPTGL